MGITGTLALSLLWLIVGDVPDTAFGSLSRLLLVAMFFLFVVASLAITEVIPWRSRSWADWRRPKVLGSVVGLLLAAVTFIADVGNIFNQPVATEATAQAGLDQSRANGDVLNDIGDAVGLGEISRIRRRIGGIWGESAECAVSYRFTLDDRSLQMVSVRSGGVLPLDEGYTVTEDSDRFGPDGERISVMETRAERGLFEGYGVTFTFATNGTHETLRWQPHKPNTNSPIFVRCRGEQ